MHVLIWGGVLGNVPKGDPKYYILLTIHAITYTSVNCYALTSGYLNVNKNFKLKRILNLWLQVFFYTAGFTLLFKLFMPESVGLKEIIKSIFPITLKQYWYFTAYFVVYMLSPFFNFILQKMKKQDLKKLIILLIVIFSAIPTLRCEDVFATELGFSPLWLSIMYIIGGYIKLHVKEVKKKTKIKLLSIWAISTLLTVGSRLISDLIIKNKISFLEDYSLYHYTSLTVVLAALCLFVLFVFADIKGIFKKVVSFLAPMSFGIYLIHVNQLVWYNILEKRFAFAANYNIFEMLLIILLIIIGIFITCATIDYLRILLFKLIKVDKFTEKIDIKLTKLTNNIIKE